jgi:hypothetical protein
MLSKILLITLTVLLSSSVASNLNAQQDSYTMNLGFQTGNWKFIADKSVKLGPDHDVIHVSGNDNFRQLKIMVTDAPLKITDMKIHFENGDVFDVAVHCEIRQGHESRIIDLPGSRRSIRKIEFWYSTIGKSKGTARVALWGRR